MPAVNFEHPRCLSCAKFLSMTLLFVVLFSAFQYTPILYAQTARDLVTQKAVVLNVVEEAGSAKNPMLFVQDNCEACENALQNLSLCEQKIRSMFSIVAMENEVWAQKLQTSPVIQKIQPQNFYLMSFAEAKKMKVFGTPTYLPGLDKKLRPRTCDQIQKEMKL